MSNSGQFRLAPSPCPRPGRTRRRRTAGRTPPPGPEAPARPLPTPAAGWPRSPAPPPVPDATSHHHHCPAFDAARVAISSAADGTTCAASHAGSAILGQYGVLDSTLRPSRLDTGGSLDGGPP